eukprot:tig00000955_g5788.t1
MEPAYIRGIITILGGLVGYLRKGSKASLIAGGGTGSIMLAAGWLIAETPLARTGHVLGAGISLMLAGGMGARAAKAKSLFPAGVVAVIGAIGVYDHVVRLLPLLQQS